MQSCSRGFRLMLMGPPGSGKGHLSNKITETYDCEHISTGDKLRRHVLYKTALGKKVRKFLKAGELVPDELLTTIVTRSIEKAGKRNIILDGYPRTLAQARSLGENINLDMVFNLEVSYFAILKRVRKRLVHLPSGRVYNDGENAPMRPGYDDVTGERLVRRKDDDPAVLLHRLKTYHAAMQPLIQFYRKQNVLVDFHVRKHEDLWPQAERYLSARWRRRPCKKN